MYQVLLVDDEPLILLLQIRRAMENRRWKKWRKACPTLSLQILKCR